MRNHALKEGCPIFWVFWAILEEKLCWAALYEIGENMILYMKSQPSNEIFIFLIAASLVNKINYEIIKYLISLIIFHILKNY